MKRGIMMRVTSALLPSSSLLMQYMPHLQFMDLRSTTRKLSLRAFIFQEKLARRLRHIAKYEKLNTMDLSACAHFKYENTASDLSARVLLIEKSLKEGDKENGAYGEPAALFF